MSSTVRQKRLVAALASLAALVFPASGADAHGGTRAAETCAGQIPTMGTDPDNPDGMASFEGTPGDDVILIVTDDIGNKDLGQFSVDVSAFGGDDVICVRNNDDSGTKQISIYVDAGDGDDFVKIPRAGNETPRSNYVIQYAEDLDLDMRTGPSGLALSGVGGGTGTIQGGTGPNKTDLSVHAGGTVKVNLKEQFLKSGGGRYTVRNIRHVSASANKLVMTGDHRANWFVVGRTTCKAVLKGGKGRDRLFATDVHDYGLRAQRACRKTRILYGQDGDDKLGGSVYSDRIIGGPGTDITDAGGGFDTCRTVEVIRSNSCERT